jgi:hypothetical protein
MDYPRFLAGGAMVLAPIGERVRLVFRYVNMPGHDLELHNFGIGSQQGVGTNYPVEIIAGGRQVLSEAFNLGFATSCYALPFYRFEAQCTLEMYVTNVAANPTSLSGHLEGIYVPRL